MCRSSASPSRMERKTRASEALKRVAIWWNHAPHPEASRAARSRRMRQVKSFEALAIAMARFQLNAERSGARTQPPLTGSGRFFREARLVSSLLPLQGSLFSNDTSELSGRPKPVARRDLRSVIAVTAPFIEMCYGRLARRCKDPAILSVIGGGVRRIWGQNTR